MREYTVVAIDETGDWDYPDLVARSGGKIYTLYAFDPAERNISTASSKLPSYWMVPFDVVPYLRPENPKDWEEMYDDLQDGLNEGCFANYFPSEPIDALDVCFKHTEEFDDDVTLDEALEHFRGNGTAPEACK